MAGQKFGKSDPDLTSRVGKRHKTKEIADAPLPKVTDRNQYAPKIGGITNSKQTNQNYKKSGPHGSIRGR